MTDFISRMGAIEALGVEPLVWCDRDEYGQGVNDQWRCDVKALKAVPTADVVERKQGTWIFEDRKPVNRGLKTNEFAYCDQCGGTAPGYPFWEGDLELTKFCPHCGARML